MTIENRQAFISRVERIPSTSVSITELEIKYVTDAIENGWGVSRNSYIERFTAKFNDYIGIDMSLPVASCTAALTLAMHCLDIGPNDQIIVPEITWVASASPVHHRGAKIVFADIEPDSWCISPESFESCITPKTKAVVVVDTYGNMPDWEKIITIARNHDIFIIEDAAESLGAEYKNKKAGSFGDIACFSFNATKIANAGQGGVFSAKDSKIMERAYSLAHHGLLPYNNKTFWSVEPGYNFSWTNIQAAQALAQLERLPELLEIKRRIFDWYSERLSQYPELSINQTLKDRISTHWMVNVIPSGKWKIEKEVIAKSMDKYMVDTRPFFYPLSLQEAFASHASGEHYEDRNPIAYQVSKYGISLPYGMDLTENDVDYICSALIRALIENENYAKS